MKKVLFLVDFPCIDETSNLAEYFINKHNTYCKELNFSFPEHQTFLKSIKNIAEKTEKIKNILEKKALRRAHTARRQAIWRRVARYGALRAVGGKRRGVGRSALFERVSTWFYGNAGG